MIGESYKQSNRSQAGTRVFEFLVSCLLEPGSGENLLVA